ncbi:MAG: ABC transporter permease, partial [Deltaproteobacteria bacterium]|nr:ABC transporter permease [Deltaproteobacteria bacterium]
MFAYLIRRMLSAIPVMAIVAVFVFLLIRLAPGDPAAIIAGDYATAESIKSIRASLGLDQPIHEQFLLYLGRLAKG